MDETKQSENKTKEIKFLSVVLAACFGVAFLGNMFGLRLNSGFYSLVGAINFGCVICLLRLAFKK